MAIVAAFDDTDDDYGGNNDKNGCGGWNDQIQIHQHC